MKNNHSHRPLLKLTNSLTLELKLKVLLITSALSLIAGLLVFIVWFTANSDETKAETRLVSGPTAPTAHFTSGTFSFIDFGKATELKNISGLSNSGYLSITLWVKLDKISDTDKEKSFRLFSLADSTANNGSSVFMLGYNSSNSHFQFSLSANTMNQVTSSTEVIAGKWYHIACVYNGNTAVQELRLYVNGHLENTETLAGNISAIPATAKLYLGQMAYPTDVSGMFNGYIDEASVWKIALGKTQIDSIINYPESVMGNSYKRAGLISYWDFTNTLNSNVYDLASSGINGKFGSVTKLPLELVSFTASSISGKVDLKWVTEAVLINDYFSVERSKDGQNFTLVGTKNGVTNIGSPIEYKYADANPYIGINYYRLKQNNSEGTYRYSSVIAVNTSLKSPVAENLTAHLNPYTGTINVNYSSLSDGIVEASLYDIYGRVVKKIQTEVNSGTNIFSINDNSGLSVGVYMLEILNGSNTKQLVKIIKTS
jgi:hypothetical protein